MDAVGEENYEIFKKADLGDFLGVEGEVMRTDMDLSVVKKWRPWLNKESILLVSESNAQLHLVN